MKKVNQFLLRFVFGIILFFGQTILLNAADTPKLKININIRNETLKTIFNSIEKTSGYIFIYNEDIFNSNLRKSISVRNETIENVLGNLLHDLDVVYKIDGRQVYITKKNKVTTEEKSKPAIKKISGIVLDEKGLPVIGASVIIPGTNIGVATDINGRFTLEVPTNAKLRISYIGYDAKEEEIKGSSDIKILLEPTPTILTELVISAQAIGQKNAIRQQINSNTIKNVVAADRLQENPDANATEAIGRLPGISIQRSGGEGTGLVIRGLEPKYTSVTLNGVLMPSSGGGSRETNISGISQYVLQGVEVYKSLTADMEANSPAGSVNLKLREADKGFRSNLIVQLGYNNMNNYFGNYKISGEVSNRFLDNKLGVFFSASAEKVNRSTQTISAGYSLYSNNINDGILIDGVNLNYILKTIYRKSAMLLLDYKVLPSTVLNLYGLYTSTRNDTQSQAKSYTSVGAGNEYLNFNYNPNANNGVFQTTLSGLTKSKFLKIEMDYGVAFSNSLGVNPQSRGWSFVYTPPPTSATFSQDLRKEIHPEEIVALYNDKNAFDETLLFSNMGQSKSNFSERNITSYLNVKIPFEIGKSISGNVKFGGTYRKKIRSLDILDGSQLIGNNQFGRRMLLDSLPWLISNGLQEAITAEGLKDHRINNYMDGKYDYGYYYDFDKLNQITDKWEAICNSYYNQGGSIWENEKTKVGFQQNIAATIMNDQNIVEDYGAGYLMTEINFGKKIMFLPGIRFEETNASMKGFYAVQPNIPGSIYDETPGNATSATRSDKFSLPMIHLRIKPNEYFYTHIAYTKTLSRPDFSSISPNTWLNTGIPPFAYTSNNPDLRPEQWTNYDIQFTLHGPKIGLLSINGFYKTVTDKIWNRNYKRIKGDPILEPFRDADIVNVSITENHQYPIYLKGVEVELQTSFWYLPKPFSYFTFTSNYTYTNSKTQNPYSYIKNVVPAGGGRPVATRIDSTISGVMPLQPKHIMNASLGFNRKGLNIWLSYQYNGMNYSVYTSNSLNEINSLKEFYNRWDLQISQRLSGKLKGLEFVANIANLSNFTETSRQIGDARPTYMEKYGWTADLGLRYKF